MTQTNSTRNLKHKEKSTKIFTKNFGRISSSSNFTYRTKQLSLNKTQNYTQKLMRSITQYNNPNIHKTRKRAKNLTVDK